MLGKSKTWTNPRRGGRSRRHFPGRKRLVCRCSSGDGKEDAKRVSGRSGAGSANGRHTWRCAGIYTVPLTLIDSGSTNALVTHQVVVSGPGAWIEGEGAPVGRWRLESSPGRRRHGALCVHGRGRHGGGPGKACATGTLERPSTSTMRSRSRRRSCTARPQHGQRHARLRIRTEDGVRVLARERQRPDSAARLAHRSALKRGGDGLREHGHAGRRRRECDRYRCAQARANLRGACVRRVALSSRLVSGGSYRGHFRAALTVGQVHGNASSGWYFT